MPKETGCSEASISTTVAPGGDGYPDLNGVIIGAKASETEDDPNAAIIPESKREKVELSSKELKEVAEGDYYENITVDNPDSSAE